MPASDAADVAGTVLKACPRHCPGQGDHRAGAPPQTGDITARQHPHARRPGRPARSPAPDPARNTAPAVTQDRGR